MRENNEEEKEREIEEQQIVVEDKRNHYQTNIKHRERKTFQGPLIVARRRPYTILWSRVNGWGGVDGVDGKL